MNTIPMEMSLQGKALLETGKSNLLSTSYLYTYDNKGNWTRREDRGPIPAVYERTITYY